MVAVASQAPRSSSRPSCARPFQARATRTSSSVPPATWTVVSEATHCSAAPAELHVPAPSRRSTWLYSVPPWTPTTVEVPSAAGAVSRVPSTSGRSSRVQEPPSVVDQAANEVSEPRVVEPVTTNCPNAAPIPLTRACGPGGAGAVRQVSPSSVERSAVVTVRPARTASTSTRTTLSRRAAPTTSTAVSPGRQGSRSASSPPRSTAIGRSPSSATTSGSEPGGTTSASTSSRRSVMTAGSSASVQRWRSAEERRNGRIRPASRT